MGRHEIHTAGQKITEAIALLAKIDDIKKVAVRLPGSCEASHITRRASPTRPAMST
jgi:hypothetical protein